MKSVRVTVPSFLHSSSTAHPTLEHQAEGGYQQQLLLVLFITRAKLMIASHMFTHSKIVGQAFARLARPLPLALLAVGVRPYGMLL